MVIENILREEILGINRGIIKKRVSLKKLLENPVIEEGNRKIKIEREMLEDIARVTSLPLSSIFIPITFFIPSGSYEGYLMDSRDARLLRDMGYEIYERNDRFWIPKHKIRKLIARYPGIFQSVIVP